MNYSTDGQYSPPENSVFRSGPVQPHFVPHEIWNGQKRCIRKISTYAAASVLLFILLSSVFSGIAQAILTVVSVSSTAAAYQQFAEKWNSAEFQYVFEIIYSVLVVGGPFFFFGKLAKKRGFLETIPMEKPRNARLLPIIVIGAFGICLFGNIVTSYFSAIIEAVFGFRLQMPQMPETGEKPFNIVMFYLSTAVVPALIEEMAHRGIIMQQLRRYGDMFAIVCSSLIFGLMHCNLMQIPFAILAGFAIGYAVIVTESLWTGIIIHFLNNAFSVTVSIVTDLYGIESTAYAVCNVIYISVLLVGGLCTFIYLKKFGKPLKKTRLVNQGKNFYGVPHPYSARVSEKMLYKEFLINVPMILAFIAVLYETVVITMTFSL